MITQFFPYQFLPYMEIFFLFSDYFVWVLHTLLDRCNLCHTNVSYRLICLLSFLSIVIQEFLYSASGTLCEFTIFQSHFCLVLAFLHCAFFAVVIILTIFNVFNLFSSFLACVCFQPQILILYLVKLIQFEIFILQS